VRVVAGELRGRRIEAPPGAGTRPTTDKVREAVFNALVSRDVIRDARVADLFAGTGALGIEALSRGADHCTFVERDRNVVRILRANLEQLGLTARSRVLAADALSQAAAIDADIALADPPYDFDAWPLLLAAVRAPLLVAEAGRSLESLDGLAQSGWEATRSKRYGRTWITFFERMDR
jgi:16S rRNA (guanine966-N2)-methyltransferase